jgi:hypothetical protein
MNEKERKLLRHMGKIHLECYKMDTQFKTAWFYPEYNRVKGYLGTARLIITGINPSYGQFPGKPVKFFYDCLDKFELHNVHITDIIKSRLSNCQLAELKRNKKLYAKVLEKNIKWLKQEVKIIDRDLNVKIIGIGKDAHDILGYYFKDKVADIWLHHYSWVESYGEESRREKRKVFKKEIRKIKKEFSNYYCKF